MNLKKPFKHRWTLRGKARTQTSRVRKPQSHKAAKPQPNGAKRLECARLALHVTLIFGGLGQCRIPKGFHLKAQGCEERATLGNVRARINSEGVVPGD